MSGHRVLPDTSIVLDILDGIEHVADVVDGCVVYISVITRVELLASFKPTPVRTEAALAFIADCKVVQFSQEVQDAAIAMRRDHRLKLPDAIIAATARYLGLQLITADKKFARGWRANGPCSSWNADPISRLRLSSYIRHRSA